MFKEQLLSRIQLLEVLQYTLLGAGLAACVLCLLAFLVVRRNNRKKLAGDDAHSPSNYTNRAF